MFKLVKIPDNPGAFLGEFKDIFTAPTHESFSQMAAGISICAKSKMVYNPHETMADDCDDKRHVLHTIGSSITQSGTRMK
ncbi:MAG: hypothetical protein SVM80_11365 [Halobacteriota archaeon]|nr:hypothetical protein [Halobacteriota archaeon]